MSKVMKWNYKGKADIIYGEVKENKTTKIILAIIIVLAAALFVSVFLFRNYLYDIIFNPQLVINLDSENGAYIIGDINYGDSFTPNIDDYIDSSRTIKYDDFMNVENKNYTYELIESNVDTNNIGTYYFKYNSSNRIKSTELTFKVNVVDIKGPTITFTDDVVDDTLTVNINDIVKDGTIVFDPLTYIKSISDNCSSEEECGEPTFEYFIVELDGSESTDLTHIQKSVDQSFETITESYSINVKEIIDDVLKEYDGVKLKDSIDVYDITLDILKENGVELIVDDDTDLDLLLTNVEFTREIIITTYSGFINYNVTDGAGNLSSKQLKLNVVVEDKTTTLEEDAQNMHDIIENSIGQTIYNKQYPSNNTGSNNSENNSENDTEPGNNNSNNYDQDNVIYCEECKQWIRGADYSDHVASHYPDKW